MVKYEGIGYGMLHTIDNFYTVIDLAYFEGESDNLDFRFVRIKIIFGLENGGNIFFKVLQIFGGG